MGKRKNMINRLHKNNGGSKAKGVKSNPFSKHQHRVKHQVLGRRLRGVTKADGEARR